jgi:hypothetical protein
VPFSPNIKKEEVMKKSTIAIPVALALLSFGVSTQTMALEVEDNVVPVAVDNSTAVGVDDTLNGNKVLNDEVKGDAAANDESIALNDNKIELKKTDIDTDIDVDSEAEVEHGDYNAVAGIGDATVDKSIKINVKDVNIATIKSDVKGEVKDVELTLGKDLEQKSYGNVAESGNASYQKNDSDQYAKSSQTNKEFAVNASLQAEKTKQDNDAVGVNVPVGVNVNENGDQSATPSGNVDQDQDALALQGNKSDDPANKADNDNKADQDADAKVKSDQGKQANSAKVANDADLANTTTQTALADAGTYTSTQSQTVSLTTGSNSMSNMSVNGVNAIAQNSGVQSFIQQTQNVQANVY